MGELKDAQRKQKSANAIINLLVNLGEDTAEELAIKTTEDVATKVRQLSRQRLEEMSVVELRQNKHLNNIVQQNHRFTKKLVNPGTGFGSFNTARQTIKGAEIMKMMRQGQFEKVEKGVVSQKSIADKRAI